MFRLGKYKVPLKFALLAAFLVSMLICVCDKRLEDESDLEKTSDLQRILESGVLKVVTDCNSTDYFLYHGRPKGYQYELILALCKELGVRPEISAVNNMDESCEGLISGRFDLVAKDLAVVRDKKPEIVFTFPFFQTRQVLVQRDRLAGSGTSAFISKTSDLAGKIIHVQQNSNYFRRITDFSQSIGYPVEIVEDSVNGTEKLISLVARGKIDYTVCNENIALLNRSYYSNLDVSLKISLPINISWAVRSGSKEWADFLNHWIENFIQTEEYRKIYTVYFKNPYTSGRFRREFNTIFDGGISQYDSTIKHAAAKQAWDWRLIAAIMYHESRFDPDSESFLGAVGLMQLMPETAEFIGIEDIYNVQQNIEGGALLLSWLDRQFKETVKDSAERINFVLAAYNIGLGRVQKAQRQAAENGKNQQIWKNNVDYFLRKKSAEAAPEDSVIRTNQVYDDTFYFVDEVIATYRHYQNLIPG